LAIFLTDVLIRVLDELLVVFDDAATVDGDAGNGIGAGGLGGMANTASSVDMGSGIRDNSGVDIGVGNGAADAIDVIANEISEGRFMQQKQQQYATDFDGTAELAGFQVPRIGMGLMALSIEGRPSSREQAIDTIHAALDAGVLYFDTAWSYYLPSRPGIGAPEDMGYGEFLVRDALRSWGGPRDKVLVATKTGFRRICDASAAFARGAGSGEDTGRGGDAAASRQQLRTAGSRYGWMADSRPETMISDAKESAQRLGVETLDLLFSHGPDPAVPYEDQMGALRQLIDEGVVRNAGISRVDNHQIDIAASVLGSRLVAVQNQFSPSCRDGEETMRHCAELGLAYICFSPLGGFLDAFDHAVYDPFRAVAAERGVSYQQVVLAWELTRYQRLFVIPSARNPHEICDSFAAEDLRLSEQELRILSGE
jgi:aryl-alcohol dehydrogenase-like predicted oxidoreductase